MIEAEAKKRGRWIGLAILVLISTSALDVLLHKNGVISGDQGALISDLLRLVGLAWLPCWIKGHYHWAKAKGWHPAFCLLGLLVIVAPIVLACLPDRCPQPPPIGEQVCHCPECDASYRLSDYRIDVEEITCSACKVKFPRPVSEG